MKNENNKKTSITKKPTLLSKVSTSSDILEKQKKYYNQIAIDESYKDMAKMSGAQKDKFGNLAGNKFDLAMDLGFSGRLIAVLHLYTGEGFDFKYPKEALEQKGFEIHRWSGVVPRIDEFRKVLTRACQLWIISHSYSMLQAEHVEAIKEFFDQGRGVFIWGDNEPYFADANKVAEALFKGKMTGNVPGGVVVKLQVEENKAGLVPTHLISTGIDYLFEGITIATISKNPHLDPLFYGSADNLVAAVYDKYGKRAILDGGFTRLYLNWDTAGTGRYVKNAG